MLGFPEFHRGASLSGWEVACQRPRILGASKFQAKRYRRTQAPSAEPLFAGVDARQGWLLHDLIASTTTTKGLRVRAALDTDEYPTGVKVDDATMAALRLTPDEFHGEWNYAIAPAEPAQLRKQPRKLREKL